MFPGESAGLFRWGLDCLNTAITYDAMPNLKPEIVYPLNRQYSMSAAKVCLVNSVACNLPYHIISIIEIYLVIDDVGRN